MLSTSINPGKSEISDSDIKLDDLPPELILNILRFTDIEDKNKIRGVSRLFKTLVNDSEKLHLEVKKFCEWQKEQLKLFKVDSCKLHANNSVNMFTQPMPIQRKIIVYAAFAYIALLTILFEIVLYRSTTRNRNLLLTSGAIGGVLLLGVFLISFLLTSRMVNSVYQDTTIKHELNDEVKEILKKYDIVHPENFDVNLILSTISMLIEVLQTIQKKTEENINALEIRLMKYAANKNYSGKTQLSIGDAEQLFADVDSEAQLAVADPRTVELKKYTSHVFMMWNAKRHQYLNTKEATIPDVKELYVQQRKGKGKVKTL